jgi:Trk-type K+ transport system membrane component
MKIRNVLKDIREFFWPLLEKPKEAETPQVSQIEIDLKNDDDTKVAFELALKINNDEQDRNRTIETKSLVFIGSIGFVVTFVIGITNSLLTGQHVFFNVITAGMLLAAIILIAYFVRSSWYSIKALARQNFRVLHFDDVIKGEKVYLAEIIAKIANNTKENAKIINLRVDYMAMAQEYYKRAIVTLFIYCIFVLAVTFGKLQIGSEAAAVFPERLSSLLRNGNLLYLLIVLILIINTALLGVLVKRIKP